MTSLYELITFSTFSQPDLIPFELTIYLGDLERQDLQLRHHLLGQQWLWHCHTIGERCVLGSKIWPSFSGRVSRYHACLECSQERSEWTKQVRLQGLCADGWQTVDFTKPCPEVCGRTFDKGKDWGGHSEAQRGIQQRRGVPLERPDTWF